MTGSDAAGSLASRRTGEYRYELTDDETPSDGVIAAVAAASDRAPVPDAAASSLPPLYGTVDPDALDAMAGEGHGAGEGPTVSFAYAGYDVTVHDGVVTLTLRDDGRRRQSGDD
ncbi:MAG: HalOD1 output domain-containing protein [Haloarculaceae archaeon]